MPSPWEELVEDKRKKQKGSIPKEWLIALPPETEMDVTKVPEECGLLSSKEIDITNTEVPELLVKLAKGEWSSVEVTTAFYKRAVVAHQLTNCLTEIFVDKALERAEYLDSVLKETGQPVGPLHGLPVSLKDQISIKGLETTMGYVSWIGKYAEKNAILTDILYECGAVPFVRTNVPQTLMWPETYNTIFGRTVNPYNRKLTSGGSSGGEGVLIALRGSPLGVGSDIGGSVRIPASFNGVYGLRPSYGRIPYAGCVNSMEGQDSVVSVLGPLSRSLGGIKAFVEAVSSRQPWLRDPLSPRKKWDEEEYRLCDHGGGKQLCFGIVWQDDYSVPHPPVLRALQNVKKALVAAGHKVIDWQPLKHAEICDNLGAIWGAAAMEDYRNTTAPTSEPIIHSMREDSLLIRPGFRPPEETVSAYELWKLHKKKRDLREEYLDHWEATVRQTGTGRAVDAIIAPVATWAAPPHGLNTCCHYTMVWNALNYTSCAFPVTKVDDVLDVKRPAHEFISDFDKEAYELYDPQTFKNAPVGLQLVGRTMEEEAVIAMAQIVESALHEIAKDEGRLGSA